MKKIATLFLCLFGIALFSQNTISGIVYDEYLEPFPGATIKLGSSKTTSDIDGNFKLKIKKKLPITIEVTSVGYGKEIVEVTSFDQELNIVLKEQNVLDQVVVSASRTPERILESPVTVERFGLNDIRKNSSINFYDGLENLKGVDINTSSLGFKSINTRGFANFENSRFVQLIDGMDNVIPSLSFAMGNMGGSPDIDIENVEVLPGAASALYGANAFNGILLMRTKNPFDYQGITVQLKSGVTSQTIAGTNALYAPSIRAAHAFNDKIAAKVTFSYYRGEEWHAGDIRNTTGVRGTVIDGDRSYLDYDGVNVYGDEVEKAFFDTSPENPKFNDYYFSLLDNNSTLLEILSKAYITRTGYQEKYLVNNKAKKLNFNGAIHYRPLGNEKLEIIWNSRINQWDNLYQGENRYNQKEFYTHQHKLEFKGNNFFLSGYYSQNKAGKSYHVQNSAIRINSLWKPNDQWFYDYGNAFVSANDINLTEESLRKLHLLSQAEANKGKNGTTEGERLEPNSSGFKEALNKVISNPNPITGAGLKDETSFYNIDFNFNLRNYVNWAEIIAGVSYRAYELKSFGHTFTDATKPITYDEYGTYLQVQKSILDKRLKFTGSIRYDKSKNFKANYSPRIAVTYAAGDNKQHNFRGSFQTAFRNPTAQEQYMGLQVAPRNHILGTVSDNIERYSVDFKNPSSTGKIYGTDVNVRGYTVASVKKYLSKVDSLRKTSDLKIGNYDLVKPEQLKSVEIGYRGLLSTNNKNLLEVDFNTYFNTYKDFIIEKEVILTHLTEIERKEALELSKGNSKKFVEEVTNNYSYRIPLRDYDNFRVKTNLKTAVKSYGIALGLRTKIFKNFDIGGSYSFADFSYDKNADKDFKPGFNLPKHKVKVQFGNNDVFKNVGFNLQARWQDEYYWQSGFLEGNIEARTMVDAQINLKVPSIKSNFKIGGTNLLGKEYFSAPGTGAVGSIYYLSWTIND